MDDSRAALLGDGREWAPPGRLDGLPPYPLADVPDIKARLLGEGRTVIDLGVGDPGLPVPEAAVETLRQAVGDPALSKYGFQRGAPRYRQAIAGWLSRRFDAEVDPDLEVLPVNNAAEAIEISRVTRPNLITMDMMMPDMDGFEFAEAIRKDPELRGCQLVMLSSAASADDPQRCNELGIARYMTKPVIQSNLLDAILEITTAASGKHDAFSLSKASRHPGTHGRVVL